MVEMLNEEEISVEKVNQSIMLASVNDSTDTFDGNDVKRMNQTETVNDNTTSSSQQRIQIRAGIDSGMPVIERGFEKDGEDRGVRSGDGESGGAEKPMSKFMMRQLGLL